MRINVLDSILTSASSGVYNWSNVIDISKQNIIGSYTLQWYVLGDGDGVTFAWSGSTKSDGTFITASTLIAESASSITGDQLDGVDFSSFDPDYFPFMKIGAKAVGTTTAVDVNLIIG